VNRKISEYIVKKFGWVSSGNFSERYKNKFDLYDEYEVERFCSVINELAEIKDVLIKDTLENNLISYRTPDGLGSICVTCVEEYVTPVLFKMGFSTKIIARQFHYIESNSFMPGPPIHAYNIVSICGTDFIVDIDVDPFAGRNTGIFITPAKTSLKIYNSGFVYHDRNINQKGKIESFNFTYHNDSNKLTKYACGNFIDDLSIAPYHGESNDNYCPIVIIENVTLYFSYDKCYIANKLVHKISIVLVCPLFKYDTTQSLQINIYGVKSFYINHLEPLDNAISSTIFFEFISGRKSEVLISKDGTIIENKYFRYQHDKIANSERNLINIRDKFLQEPIMLPGKK
jgi:hypothetical protein